MNYFIDTNALAITHPNRYTAIETVTLLPVYNAKLIEVFFNENHWVRDYLPNHPGPVNHSYLLKDKNQPLKKLTEGILDILFPEKINAMLMNLTDRKWRRKWKRAGYPGSEYDRAFMTTLHVSKNHPVDYEKKVLSALKETSISKI